MQTLHKIPETSVLGQRVPRGCGQEKPERPTHTTNALLPLLQNQSDPPQSSCFSITCLDSVRGSNDIPSIRSEDSPEIQKHPQKCSSASEVALRRKEEDRSCLRSTMQGLWMYLHRGNLQDCQEVPKWAQECGKEARHKQWYCSPHLDQLTPSRLEDKRNERKLLEEKGTGSPTHPPTAAHLQLTVVVINPYWLLLLDNPACSWQFLLLDSPFHLIHVIIILFLISCHLVTAFDTTLYYL